MTLLNYGQDNQLTEQPKTSIRSSFPKVARIILTLQRNNCLLGTQLYYEHNNRFRSQQTTTKPDKQIFNVVVSFNNILQISEATSPLTKHTRSSCMVNIHRQWMRWLICPVVPNIDRPLKGKLSTPAKQLVNRFRRKM